MLVFVMFRGSEFIEQWYKNTHPKIEPKQQKTEEQNKQNNEKLQGAAPKM